MDKVIVMDETTQKPITLIGEMAGICYGSDTSNPEKNYKRGLECIKTNHGRVLEFPQVYLILDGYSARAMRELYTHIGGAPTRLQASTRYINYKNFDYFIPDAIINNTEAYNNYVLAMENLWESYEKLLKQGVSKEDAANILPLGMNSKMVLRTNLRNLINIMRQRTCKRAYSEIRYMMYDIQTALNAYGEEWRILNGMELFKPKCEYLGYCPEKNSCGRKPKKQD